jgi:excisionase family DNA binding protein
LLPDFAASLTVKEVAARLRVCTATVYRLCADGELRHFRVGAAIRIGEEDLAAYQAR